MRQAGAAPSWSCPCGQEARPGGPARRPGQEAPPGMLEWHAGRQSGLAVWLGSLAWQRAENRLMQPLSGLLVLDFSTLLPGPMASLLLAEAGAEVIKIERPGRGEDMRAYARSGEGQRQLRLLNRARPPLRLTSRTLRPRNLEPVARADILIEQSRPGITAASLATRRWRKPSRLSIARSRLWPDRPNRTGPAMISTISGFGPAVALLRPSAAPVVPPADCNCRGAYPAVMNILLARASATPRGGPASRHSP